MTLATPVWFDSSYYAEQKLDQLSLLKWDGKIGWTNSAYEAELAKYGVTPYENFVASNEVHDLKLTNLSPNPLFNVGEYLTALAQYANRTNYSYPGYKAGEWTAQKAMQHMFNDYHVSAWDHFTLAGQYNLINPSNDFDITAYYDQLTAWRNNYVDPDTGVKGWEGRTDWTRQDVIEDNIWNQVNPIEGLYGEASGSGIRPQAVPASDQVKVDADWNPWVASTGQTTPGTSNPIKPGKPVPGGSAGSGGDDAADDGWQPDETVQVTSNKGTFTGSDGEDTLFEARNGLNPDSVIDGGEDSENVLNVNMKGNFAGFNGVKDGSATGPNLINVQTVNLINNSATGEAYTFNGKNTDGVDNWNIENGPVNLQDLPDTQASVGIRNVKTGGVEINFDQAALKSGDNTLTLNVNNVGTETTPVKGNPLNVSAQDAISKVVVNAAQNSENLVDLSGVSGAKDIKVNGAGSVSLANMGENVQTVDASAMTGQFTATLDGGKAPGTIKGGKGSDDSVILGSGAYSGKWSGIENAVVDGAGYVSVNGADVTGLQNLVINHYTPEENSNINIENIKAASFSVEESSSPESYSWTNVYGEIDNFQYTATRPYEETTGKTRDVVVEKTAVGTNFRTDASDTATVTVEEGVSLSGEFHFSQAKNVSINGPGQFGNWRPLEVQAPNAEKVTATLHGDSDLNFWAIDGMAEATVKGDNNYVWANGQTAAISDGAGANTLQMSVRESGTITGGGGADRFVIDGMTLNGGIDPGQPEVITVKINGDRSADSESFDIQSWNVYKSMAVTINGYDETDQRITTGNGGFATVDQEQAEELILKLFGPGAGELEQIQNDHEEICGYYDAASKTAYGFTWNANGEINVGVRLTDIDSPELAARALGYEPNRLEDVQLKPGQLVYTAPIDSDGNPLPTCFWAVVSEHSDDSTLVSGVQITGPYNGEDVDLDRIVVDMYADFYGLGPDGYMKGVPWLQLYDEENRYNDVNRHLAFNAENMYGIDMLRLAYAQYTVTNMGQGLHSLDIIDAKAQDAIIAINYSEGALDNYNGYLQLSVDGVGSEKSSLAPTIEGVTDLSISTYEGWHQNVEHGNWLDISNLSEVVSLTISCSTDLDLTAHDMYTGENVNIYVNGWNDDGILQGELDFTNTPSLNFENWYGKVGTNEEALLLSAEKAEEAILDIYGATNIELNTPKADVTFTGVSDGLPEFMNIKVDAARSFESSSVIRANQANFDLRGAEAQQGSLDFWTRQDLNFKSAQGGSQVNTDSQKAMLEGSSGDDTFRVHVSDSATATGNGGNDTFVAYANKGTHAEGTGPVEVTFNGTKATQNDSQATGHDTFIVNTWQDQNNTAANAKLALTITGYDEGDFLKVTDSNDDANPVYKNFAAITDGAEKALGEIFGINMEDLNLSALGEYALYDRATSSAYGVAADANGDIVAFVKLDDVSESLAEEAFAQGSQA